MSKLATQVGSFVAVAVTGALIWTVIHTVPQADQQPPANIPPAVVAQNGKPVEVKLQVWYNPNDGPVRNALGDGHVNGDMVYLRAWINESGKDFHGWQTSFETKVVQTLHSADVGMTAEPVDKMTVACRISVRKVGTTTWYNFPTHRALHRVGCGGPPWQ